MKHSLIGALLLLPLVQSAARAEPGALEINQDCVAVGCFAGDAAGYPVTITQPGTYILTSDLAPPGDSAKNAIEITASPVDIDLNGHAIDGGATCSGTPVTSCSSALGGSGVFGQVNAGTSLHIHDGNIHGFINGVTIFFAQDGTLLERLSLTQNTNDGAFIASDQSGSVRIRDAQIARNGNLGVSGSTVMFIENTSVVGNETEGLFLQLSSVVVGSRFNSNGSKGLECGGPGEPCALGQNTFRANNGGGAAAQFLVPVLSDMGGNVCLDHASSACP